MTAKMGGIDDVVNFPWPAAFEPTQSELDESARESRETFLRELERADGALRRGGAIDGDGHPTAFGRELVRFQGLGSTGGALAIMYADRLACVPEVVTILALLEDARLIGRDALLLSDFDWPDEWRVEAAERHRGLASLCEDEADLVLQICASWERADPRTPPWEPSRLRRDWARRWWISNDVLIAAAEARRDILQSLSPAMKEEVKRFVEPALLRRARGVLTRALHGLRYERLGEGFRPWEGGEEVESEGVEELVLPEPDSLFAQTSNSVIALQRRKGRDEERFVSSLVSLEAWALPEEGGDPATDALRLLVAAAEHAPPELARNARAALIESWPVGQRVLIGFGESGATFEPLEPIDVLAPFERPLTREEAEAERAETRRAKKGARRKSRDARGHRALDDQAEADGATEADQRGEIDIRRPAEERIKDEEEMEHAAFELADAEEALEAPCGQCPQCLSGHEDLCENSGGGAVVGGKIEDALHSWTARAAAGGVAHPRISLESREREGWWEVVGYRTAPDTELEVLLRRDWRPPGFVGDPTRHQDVEAGMPIEVEVGPPIRDHRDELRVFVRADGAGRFVLREATPGVKAQERREEIAVSLDRSAQGLLGGLVEGELLTATVVPARGANCFSITLLELLQQHLAKASGGPAAPRLSPDPDKEKGERVEWHTATVAALPDAWGNLGITLAHRDSERGIAHRVNIRVSSSADSPDDDPEAEETAPAQGSDWSFVLGDPVAVRLERERPKLNLRGKDLDSVKEICDEIDRRLSIKSAPERVEVPNGGDGEGEQWLGGAATHLVSTRDAPLPRATASALGELDTSPEWQGQVWAFWARSHHLKPAGKKPIRRIDSVDPVEVRAEVKVEHRTPLAARQAAIAELGEKLAPGARMEGTVTSVRNFGAFVEVAPQVDGLVTTKELRWERIKDPTEVVKRGDQVQVQVLSLDPETAELSLSVRSLLPHPAEAYAVEHAVGSAVRGTVASVVGAGVFVDLADGVRGLVPRNELGWGSSADLAELLAEGDEVEAAVVGLDAERHRLKLSIKQLQPHPFDAFRNANAVGDEVIGRIENVADIGAYVNLGGGLNGLVHVSEIAWHRVENPSDVLSEGEEVRVRVLDLDEKRRRVSLSIKALRPDPFEEFENSNETGSTVEGKVLRLSDKSAFIELKGGVEGWIPISELSWRRVGVPADALGAGETIKAKILSIDPKRRQVKLSMKRLHQHPFDAFVRRAKSGEPVTGRVASLADYGAFVELDDGVQGLIHISKLSTAFVSHPSQVVMPGQRVSVYVLDIDHANRKVSLSYAGPAT